MTALNQVHGPRAAVQLVDLPTVESQTPDSTGAISVCTAGLDCPFKIARVYWIHGVRHGEMRGQHAHKTLTQLMVAISGSFEITVYGSDAPMTFVLDSPRRGLLVGPGHWRNIRACSGGAVLLVAASAPYDEADYIRSYDEFQVFRRTLDGD